MASGSVAGTTRVVVDELRGQGRKVGMIKLKSFRPFPKEFFASIGGKFKALGVIDKSVSFGYDGTIFGDVKSSMYSKIYQMRNSSMVRKAARAAVRCWPAG